MTLGDSATRDGSSFDGDRVVIRREQPSDVPGILEVHAAAFGEQDGVPELVTALRSAPADIGLISVVACLEEQVVGHVMLSPCRLDAPRRIVDVVSLSPLGVRPEMQRQGIGRRLIDYALSTADSMRIPLVFLEGDPLYYAARGFERADVHGFRSPSLRIPEAAFQVAILSAYEPWMTGTFVYSETFWAQDSVGLRDSDS
jgi:putative acetyltransferase